MKTIKQISLIMAAFALMLVSESAKAQVNWTLSQSVGNVDFYYSIQTCGSDTVVFLKFVNNNTASVTVSWNELFDSQAGAAQPSHYSTRQLTIAPGVTQQADCLDTTCPDCLILPEEMMQTYKAVVTGFAFAAITVTP